MSDDASNEGLPNAGYRHDFSIDGSKKTRLHLLEHNLPENPRGDVDELVRRSDVEKLITDKLAKVETWPIDEEIATSQSKILQELLEEVEGEASK